MYRIFFAILLFWPSFANADEGENLRHYSNVGFIVAGAFGGIGFLELMAANSASDDLEYGEKCHGDSQCEHRMYIDQLHFGQQMLTAGVVLSCASLGLRLVGKLSKAETAQLPTDLTIDLAPTLFNWNIGTAVTVAMRW